MNDPVEFDEKLWYLYIGKLPYYTVMINSI